MLSLFKKIFIPTLVLLTLSSGAFAHEHSVTVCSSLRKDVCAHLGLESTFNTREEGMFMTHVMTPGNKAITDFKLDLWMNMGNHGHGTSPVDIAEQATNLYQITNAWFVMPGTWLVRFSFTFEGQSHYIQIPVEVGR